MRRWLAILVLAAACAPSAVAAEPAQTTRSLVIYGDEPCPESTDEEIVVCARRPETERYRIPKELRGRGDRPSETSWAARNEALDEAQRTTRPNSCSTVGTWGQTGCWQQMIRQWFAERRSRSR
ncbi:MAG TPA: hypothetical protein VFQ67_07175 [Allosphingosinicella sp.]|jgi:hypothetical protein|nr:hypothetical protein [Allosphingosinicella sp.]